MDGQNWTEIGSTFIALPLSVQAGLALTSGDELRFATATFDHVSVASGSAPRLALSGPSDLSVNVNGSWPDPGATLRPAISSVSCGLSNVIVARSGGGVEVLGNSGPELATVPSNATNLSMLSFGWGHAVALNAQGRIISWGDNSSQQTNAPLGTGFTAVAAGAYHSIAVDSAGKIRPWGDTNQSQAAASLWAPVTPVAIAAGANFNMALDASGELYVWGDNSFGQLEMAITEPNFIILGTTVAIAAGGYHALALSYDGLVHAWGDDSHGQLNIPFAATNVVAIGGGLHHSVALRADGSVIAWGDNSAGQCVVPAGLEGIVTISAGGNQSLALKQDGSLVAWGDTQASLEQLNASTTKITTSDTLDLSQPGLWTLSYSSTHSLGEVQSVFRRVTITPSGTLLSIRMESGQAVLSWPSAAGEYQLESTDTLAGGWKPVSRQPTAIGTNLVVAIEGSSTRQFFRLLKP